MTRRALFVGAVLASALAAQPARAQGPLVFYIGKQGDTATGAVPGTEVRIPVRSTNPWFYYGLYYYTVTSATLTFVYDTAKVQVLGVQAGSSGLTTINSSVAGPGTLTVSATGDAYGPDAEVYGLRVKLKPGVTDGSYLWIKSDSAALCYTSSYCYYYGTYWKPTVSAIGQLCHATQVWGDVDGNGQVDSRDALITLSAAVGLPVSGFNLAQGDVDGDGLTNSRDALMMLSFAINLPVAANARVGVGEPDACPGLTAPGDSLVFIRGDAPAALWTLGGSVTTPTRVSSQLVSTGFDVNPRLANDGGTIVYVCFDGLYQQICRVNADSTGFAQLTTDPSTHWSPDWSPAQDSIVYLQSGTIYKMAADGSGQTLVGASGVLEVRWGRSPMQLAYVDNTLHLINDDGTGNTLVTTGFSDLHGLRWSPGGDSLIIIRAGNPGVYVVPAAGGTPARVAAFTGSTTGGDWSAAGIVFSLDAASTTPGIWYLKDFHSPVFRVTRPVTYDMSVAWRRSP